MTADDVDQVPRGAAEAVTNGEVLSCLADMGFPAVATLLTDASLPVQERVRHALTILRPE